MTGELGITDISFLAVATALTSLLLAWVLAGRHRKAPVRIRRRRRTAPTGALTLLLAAEFSGRYADLLRFAERQLMLVDPAAASQGARTTPDATRRVLIRRLRRLDRRMRWTGSPWWPSLDLWRSAEDRRARLQHQLESVLRDVNVHAEAGGSAG